MKRLILFLYLIVCSNLYSENYTNLNHQNQLSIIGELPSDDDLLKHIQNLSDENKKICSYEYFLLLEKIRQKINFNLIQQDDENHFLHQELSAIEALEIFGPCIKHTYSNEELYGIFEKMFFPEFYFFKKTKRTLVEPQNYFETYELEEIYLTARKILQKTSKGDLLISLGQSPAYVIEALEALISKDPNEDNFRQILKVPYSGAADFRYQNSHYKTYKLSNIVIPRNLIYYKWVLEQKGLNPLIIDAQQIYIVDLIGSGGSMTSFLKILINWYKELDLELPNIKLLDISVANRNFKSLEQVILPVTETCYFCVPRSFIHTSAHLSDKLDYTEGEDRVIPPFEAIYWKKEYETIFNQYPNEYAKEVIKTVKAYAKQSVMKEETPQLGVPFKGTKGTKDKNSYTLVPMSLRDF